jgi:hypothetical protein
VAISASTTGGAISLSGTQARLAQRYSASSLPSADTSCAGCSVLALRMSRMPGVNGISTSTYSSSASPAAISAQSRLCSDSSFSGRRSTRAHTGRSAAQRVRRKAGKDMGFGVKSGSSA